MSYADEKKRSGREPITIVELDLDYCQLTYGVLPCTASLGKPCYNTRATCKVPNVYDPAPKTYRYCTPQAPLPVNLNAIPSVRSVSLTPSRIEIEGGLGQRATAQIVLQDHSYHDRGLDPYWQVRYGGEQVLPSGENLPGTYWGRWRARNPYYQGRVCRIKTGYVVDDNYDDANFITRTYLLESVAGPDATGKVTIKAKDPLKLADSDRSQAPRPSSGSLLADIGPVETTATLMPSGVGAEYPVSGFVRIGSEVMSFTRSGDTLTLVRAQAGTTSQDHDAEDSVQLCLRYSAKLIPDIVYDLFTNYTPIDSAYLPKSEWDAEAAAYLPRQYSALVTEPTGVDDLLKEITAQSAAAIYWDERAAEIKLRALRAPDSDDVLDENAHILQDSLTVTDKPEMRISQAWVYLAQRDATASLTDGNNYRQLVVAADLEAEGAHKFGAPAIDKTYSRWITSKLVATELAQLKRDRFGEVPRQITFALDAKDSQWWTGDVLRISTRLVQGADGSNSPLPVQIIEATEVEPGHRFSYTAQAFAVVPYIPTDTVISISANVNDVVLLNLYTSLHGAPSSSTAVTFIVEPGVIVGQNLASAAMRTGLWPVGAQVNLEIYGRIQGRGGDGGRWTGPNADDYASATDGGNALFAESLIVVSNFGEIFSGGGGGAPVVSALGASVSGGGGGAGTLPGVGGVGSESGLAGQNGTASTGGAGGPGAGDGGGPGQPGQPATGDGGDAGYYVVGNGVVTWAVAGDRRGRVVS